MSRPPQQIGTRPCTRSPLCANLSGGTIDGTEVLPAKWITEMHKLHTAGEDCPTPHWKRKGHGFAWTVAAYRDHPYLEHGGGYIGTAAHIGFLPEQNLGVAVVANADGFIGPFVVMDIFDRLLGIKDEDQLPRFGGFIERRLRQQAVQTRQRAEKRVTADRLSLPPSAYVGAYFNADGGTVTVTQRDGRLVGRQGRLALDFEATGRDAFLIHYGTGDPDSAHFDTANGKTADAMVLTLYEKPYRFARR